jgi:isopentenyl phosphate kinase
LSVKPTVLKLGGSVITNKEKTLTPSLPAIERLTKEISRANVSPLVLVHGGGSFGHPLAKRYAIKEGYKHSVSQVLGFCETHQAMVTLNKLLVDALIHQNIPAVGMPPSSCVVTKSGRIHIMFEEPLKKLLQIGFVPVLHGDAVIDSDLGFTILSGDQLTTHLSMHLNAARIIMGIDVDGLFTSDPKVDSLARLVNRITLEELKRLLERIKESKVTDVTGGMLGKIYELMPAVERGIPSFIVNAAKPKNVYKALKGEKAIGTFIERG